MWKLLLILGFTGLILSAVHMYNSSAPHLIVEMAAQCDYSLPINQYHVKVIDDLDVPVEGCKVLVYEHHEPDLRRRESPSPYIVRGFTDVNGSLTMRYSFIWDRSYYVLIYCEGHRPLVQPLDVPCFNDLENRSGLIGNNALSIEYTVNFEVLKRRNITVVIEDANTFEKLNNLTLGKSGYGIYYLSVYQKHSNVETYIYLVSWNHVEVYVYNHGDIPRYPDYPMDRRINTFNEEMSIEVVGCNKGEIGQLCFEDEMFNPEYIYIDGEWIRVDQDPYCVPIYQECDA